MKSNPTCLWLTDADFIEAETFLLQSLKDLQQCSIVHAFSGGIGHPRAPKAVTFTQFSRVQISIGATILKKTTGIDLIQIRRLRKAKIFLNPILESIQPQFAWIHFGTAAVQVCSLLDGHQVPYFIQVHGIDVTSRFADDEYRLNFVQCANSSLGVICSSQHIKRLCILEGVDPEKVIVVKNALNTDIIDSIKSERTPHPSFVHLGRLTPKKHPLATLHAFALVNRELPETTLTFIGGGTLLPDLHQRCRTLGIENKVFFKGRMDHKSALREVAKHWVFCQHSITSRNGDQEGFANSIAEAALLGLPCVTTLHNGIPEHVIEGKTGFMVREHDFESMAEKMLHLTLNHADRERFSKQGMAHYAKFYMPNHRAKAIKALIHHPNRPWQTT